MKNWLAMAVLVPLALSTGCKQGIGDRCEIDSDCASGTCSQAVPKVCISKQGDDTQIDATLPIDAPVAPSDVRGE